MIWRCWRCSHPNVFSVYFTYGHRHGFGLTAMFLTAAKRLKLNWWCDVIFCGMRYLNTTLLKITQGRFKSSSSSSCLTNPTEEFKPTAPKQGAPFHPPPVVLLWWFFLVQDVHGFSKTNILAIELEIMYFLFKFALIQFRPALSNVAPSSKSHTYTLASLWSCHHRSRQVSKVGWRYHSFWNPYIYIYMYYISTFQFWSPWRPP